MKGGGIVCEICGGGGGGVIVCELMGGRGVI